MQRGFNMQCCTYLKAISDMYAYMYRGVCVCDAWMNLSLFSFRILHDRHVNTIHFAKRKILAQTMQIFIRFVKLASMEAPALCIDYKSIVFSFDDCSS